MPSSLSCRILTMCLHITTPTCYVCEHYHFTTVIIL
uniref:Uncharacterized protein n=1 Tax=Siphoviridae sp. ctJ7x27 TaxID=2827835 RepID=A0A8S5S447_9CAUD|nr:MAG TPA: hypothetical protein [Siphoviridae sp. ctJ7x27]